MGPRTCVYPWSKCHKTVVSAFRHVKASCEGGGGVGGFEQISDVLMLPQRISGANAGLNALLAGTQKGVWNV